MEINYCFGCMEGITGYPCPHCGYAPSGSDTAYALRPGTILRGKYLVGKVLGQGGFGITYIGMDLALERKVAIKEFYPANCVGRESGSNRVLWYDTPQARDAMKSGQEVFLKEARKMSKISTIGSVVQIFDLFQENGTAYICMEFIQGCTLLQLLKQTGPLPWEKARKIFLPAIQAMAQVHQQGVVHRDISPDNLMIQADGTVKILDLGAAKDLNLNSGVSSMQVAKGGFSPLEQYMQSGDSGSWTDVYAMAATMYYTLTGVLPPSAVDRLNNDSLRWDLPQLQALPSYVRKAMEQALAVRFHDRIQTMEAFFQKLQHSISSTPIPEKDAASAAAFREKILSTTAALQEEEYRHLSKSKKQLLIALAAAVVLLIVIVAGISSRTPREETLSVPETMETVPETTEAIPETTETVPETTETVPETTQETKPAPQMTVAEAEAVITDIAGKSAKDLRATYTKLVKLKKFWKSEGSATTSSSLSHADIGSKTTMAFCATSSEPVKTENFGKSEGSFVLIPLGKASIVDTVTRRQFIPLLDAKGKICGEKVIDDPIRNSMSIYDRSGRWLFYEIYDLGNRDKINSKTRYFYDADGRKTRAIRVSYDSSDKIDSIYDTRYIANEEHCVIWVYFHYDSSHDLTVRDANDTDILEKTYDSKGKLIASY